LWSKVWYENYDEPKYVWQSTAANTDFEPKLSLSPLTFGTLKAAFYAMLLAAPLAVAAAIYTAYFMAPGMRRKVKPVIELMEAMPTVILGFFAGLFLAPYVEGHLPGIFSLLMLLPIGILVAGFTFSRLPESIRLKVPDGWESALLIPVILFVGWLSLYMSPFMENWFFGGDMRMWISHDLGITYDQRNALVVGLAMGFAVIPNIYSIAEDAVFSVPRGLTLGSLALGATPWQTMTRVVILTASPGIFSALMIGMGRAVGETMIVLMATGNTPIMEMNLFAVIMTIGLLAVIAVRGLGHFWPADLIHASYDVPGQANHLVIGEVVQKEEVPRARLKSAGLPVPDEGPEFMTRELIKVGNRDLNGTDFTWIVGEWLTNQKTPVELMALERREWGNFYGYLVNVKQDGKVIAEGEAAWPELQARINRVNQLAAQLKTLEKSDIGAINAGLERIRLHGRKLELDGKLDAAAQADMESERAELNARYQDIEARLGDLHAQFNRDSLTARDANGKEIEISLGKVVHAYQPNAMGTFTKIGFYFSKVWEFLSDDPREANTEGGIFPAIFGTVMMTLIMAMIVTPFGVLAAVYLREYAKQNTLTRVIRIAVNNLAGVPAIVYGVFGLGFFVYVLGGSLDRLFFPEALPAPTFGTPGLLWASLTLALLAVPVVIVATEEGLARIPRTVREGSLALGATKAETLWKIVLPMASPAMMTGMILAVARAAGEVAPLMLVGVVKLAPSLPVDGNYPYLHLDQKIMHLGFHIYDVGFQSPNVEAARPLVYATALLLVLVIATLNLSAVYIRNHLREKYKALDS
jgi:phosphate transport system permease protein